MARHRPALLGAGRHYGHGGGRFVSAPAGSRRWPRRARADRRGAANSRRTGRPCAGLPARSPKLVGGGALVTLGDRRGGWGARQLGGWAAYLVDQGGLPRRSWLGSSRAAPGSSKPSGGPAPGARAGWADWAPTNHGLLRGDLGGRGSWAQGLCGGGIHDPSPTFSYEKPCAASWRRARGWFALGQSGRHKLAPPGTGVQPTTGGGASGLL